MNMNWIHTHVECWPKSAFPWDLCIALPGFTWIAILKHSLSGLLLKMDLLVWCLCMHGYVCFFSGSLPVIFSHPNHPFSKTSTNLWGLSGGDSFQQRLTVLSPVCPWSEYLPQKPLGYTMASLSWCTSLCCLVWAQLPFPPCSSLHLSFHSRLVSQGTLEGGVQPWLCGSIPPSHQNRAFHWVSQGRTALLAAAMKLAPGTAPVPISWSMVHANTVFLGMQKQKAFAIS